LTHEKIIEKTMEENNSDPYKPLISDRDEVSEEEVRRGSQRLEGDAKL
jgi:hypothetical protein